MTKESLLDEHVKYAWECDQAAPVIPYSAAEKAMDQYAQPYKEIADLISRIFYYGKFKAETMNERQLEYRLREVGLWPTTEDEIIQRPEIQFIEQQNKDNEV